MMSQQIISRIICSSLALWLVILFFYPLLVLTWSNKALVIRSASIFFNQPEENYLLKHGSLARRKLNTRSRFFYKISLRNQYF